MIFQDGALISLSQLTTGTVPSGQVLYARANWADEVDLVVLRGSLDSTVIYGRVVWTVQTDESGEMEDCLGVEFGDGESGRTKAFPMRYNVSSGDYVAATLNRNNSGFSSMVKLQELADVGESAWLTKNTVLVGGRTYTVPANVLCYNADSGTWITLDAALKYAPTADLYASDDNIIRVIEVEYTA